MGLMLVSSSRRGRPGSSVWVNKSTGYRRVNREDRRSWQAVGDLGRSNFARGVGYRSGFRRGRTGRGRTVTKIERQYQYIRVPTGKVRRSVAKQPRWPRGSGRRSGRWR